MITKNEIAKKFREILGNKDSLTKESAPMILQTFFHYLLDNYNDIEESARAPIDKMIDSILTSANKFIQELPEGKEKRKLTRQLKIAIGKHHNSESLVKILEKSAVPQTELLTDTRKIFVQGLQNVLDLLSDVVETSKHGQAEFAKLALFYFCVDELLTAFHLAQHSFINQAYSHIRSILEALDKIELFHIEPKWAELWASANPKEERKRLNELSPASVRKKLGKSKHDPFYSLLSEFGPHGTFRGIQARSARRKDFVNGKPQIHFWIGGCPFEHNIIFVNSYLFFALDMMLLRIAVTYSQFLSQDEISDIFKSSIAEKRKFAQKYLIPWAKRNELDITLLSEYLEYTENLESFTGFAEGH